MRSIIGNYFLKKELKKIVRKREVFNFDDAHTIGIIYDATDLDDRNMVHNFVKYLREKQKKVDSLGFINSKKHDKNLKTQLEFHYFTKKDLTWLLKPKCVDVENFLYKNHDILIDLCIEKCFPIRYICGLSKAKFKVGRTGENSAVIYDLMLNIEKKKTLENYITQVKHYLSIINKKGTI